MGEPPQIGAALCFYCRLISGSGQGFSRLIDFGHPSRGGHDPLAVMDAAGIRLVDDLAAAGDSEGPSVIMITISLCMIVKNEEPVLARCLDSVASMMDEIIIVDTGSTDRTKEIAAQYTSRIYDFTWCDDFSAARNYAFSLATMDYIYCPDADEYLDLENQRRFLRLKGALLPEIEIVQMNYITPPDFNTVQNCKKEPRPKLFKRLRTFSWVGPVHETILTDPVIYDSDIDILHRPHAMHAKRDFAMFEKAFRENRVLSEKITRMYARELYKCGDEEDFLRAADYFSLHYEAHADAESACILAHAARIQNSVDDFFSICLKDMCSSSCSEICYEIGQYYRERQNPQEASLWFYNAAFETQPVLDIEISGKKALLQLVECYRTLAENELCDPCSAGDLLSRASEYEQQAQAWELPEEL